MSLKVFHTPGCHCGDSSGQKNESSHQDAGLGQSSGLRNGFLTPWMRGKISSHQYSFSAGYKLQNETIFMTLSVRIKKLSQFYGVRARYNDVNELLLHSP